MCGGPHTCVPENEDNEVRNSITTRNQSTTALAQTSTQGWQHHLPQSDITNCIALSKLRCIVTLVSLVLLMTDIPRTGLGIHNLQEYYPVPLMPSTAVRFGPFNYPVVNIYRLGNGSNSEYTKFAGLKGDQPVSAARVWSYQYDTTSVGLRGAVELLNVTEFPSFLLYEPQAGEPKRDANSLLDFATAFTMLDAFIDTARTELRPAKNVSPKTLRYATKHNWIDRLHQYIVRSASKSPAWRLHSLHVPHVSPETKSLRICADAAIGQRLQPRPRFCNHPGIWKCANPLNASATPVRLWHHMDLRLQVLQQRYPDLEIDVALVSTQRLSTTSGAVRSTFYNYEALEIVVLTRGRRCVNTTIDASSADRNSTTCTTVFVDDYRYERDIVQTNLVDWYGIISMLRGGAQAYVWVRLILLVYGAYVAAGETPASSSRLLSAVLIVAKIPFQVIVYSSLLPVVGYVAALVLDSSFMDIFFESYWASVGGVVSFKLVPFLKTTTVQMRGVWLIALLASAVLFAMRRSRNHGDGIPGIRGLLISFTSSLTVFGPYKNVRYRDMNITSIVKIPHEGQIMDIVRSSNPDGCFNSSSYFYDGTSRTIRLSIAAVAIVALILKLLGYFTPRASSVYRTTRGMIIKISRVAPCGIESLWVNTSPIIHFSASIRSQVNALARNSTTIKTLRVAPSHTPANAEEPFQNITAVERLSSMYLSDFWRGKQIPKKVKAPKGGLCSRTTESHSILHLMNIAMMTDPWNFFWLRVLGIQLYLYKIQPVQSAADGPTASYTVILPYTEEEMEVRTGLSSADFQLLDSASSKHIPLSVLLQCG